ncbi:MAG TPA: aspartate carbamoyltransferase catalytic subunit [Candidatus Kapabacteria bacterium]|nr:aspartate carbamoyltransferase catalytic subunit [Candidatus Kapabacteria bacterium]HOM04812.1 aspartate carbamoyltransferase catalytic subunit [Candidatus Kapabacteria bacterium]HPP39527.1 aspartate carbamoyltransferase catalytic subunit [Candidatus Kapabacteria bacterium]
MNNDYLLSKPYLINSEDLTKEDIYAFFEKAQFFLENYPSQRKFTDLKGITVALAFFEPSTRTNLSFELAAKRLSADTISFASSSSSLTKGESLIDTLRTIEAMDVQMYVVRHSNSGVPKFLQENTRGVILNAGDGKHEHPTQALLDSFTLWRHFGRVEGLKVCIAGDILHSRVARSNINVLKTLGAEVALCSPGTLLPRYLNPWDVKLIESIDDAIEWADVLLMLRLQRERMESGILPSIREFSKFYSVSLEQFSRKPELVLMHPGPVNYGVELDYRVSSFPNCLIQTQVTHGVFIRMALLSLLSKFVAV